MRRKGFTLIELIVVISVVSLLMAILLPTLTRARQQGRSVVCLNNLRQLATAACLYVNNNDGYYPIAYMSEFTDSKFIAYAWDFITIKNWSKGEEKVIAWHNAIINRVPCQ